MDRIVGRNIRVHRLAKRLSQTELGEKLGVTFQQVQKYEKGTNRVGSGRLFQISTIFEVPVTSFFEDGGSPVSKAGESPLELLTDPYSLRLVKAFSELRNTETRQAVVTLLESMVPGGRRRS
jgi:transcriptional regulator with XRE-family HTH domain